MIHSNALHLVRRYLAGHLGLRNYERLKAQVGEALRKEGETLSDEQVAEWLSSALYQERRWSDGSEFRH